MRARQAIRDLDFQAIHWEVFPSAAMLSDADTETVETAALPRFAFRDVTRQMLVTWYRRYSQHFSCNGGTLQDINVTRRFSIM